MVSIIYFRKTYDKMLANLERYNNKLGWYNFSLLPLSNSHFKVGKNNFGEKFSYFGEMKQGTTDVTMGRGITVIDDGRVIFRDYRDNRNNGHERTVYINGD
jgi:hypothetical protein